MVAPHDILVWCRAPTSLAVLSMTHPEVNSATIKNWVNQHVAKGNLLKMYGGTAYKTSSTGEAILRAKEQEKLNQEYEIVKSAKQKNQKQQSTSVQNSPTPSHPVTKVVSAIQDVLTKVVVEPINVLTKIVAPVTGHETSETSSSVSETSSSVSETSSSVSETTSSVSESASNLDSPFDPARSVEVSKTAAAKHVPMPTQYQTSHITSLVVDEDVKKVFLNHILEQKSNQVIHATEIQELKGMIFRKRVLRDSLARLLLKGFLVEESYGYYRVNL